jgi:hypothetical protein
MKFRNRVAAQGVAWSGPSVGKAEISSSATSSDEQGTTHVLAPIMVDPKQGNNELGSARRVLRLIRELIWPYEFVGDHEEEWEKRHALRRRSQYPSTPKKL